MSPRYRSIEDLPDCPVKRAILASPQYFVPHDHAAAGASDISGQIAEIRITLPWPPSVNAYWRNVGCKTLLSVRGRRYRKHAALMAMSQCCRRRLSGRLFLQAVFIEPDRRRRDLDNLQKAVWDALTHSSVIDDDSQIDIALVEKRQPRAAETKGEVHIVLREIRPTETATTLPETHQGSKP